MAANESMPRWNVAAALSGWLLPGLGHVLLGQRRRGTILMLTLGLVWLAGVTIGGIGVIDHETKPYWFFGQMLMAPTVLVDWYHQMQPADAVAVGHGRVAEQGTLYVTLAGLLNLVAMIDVLYREPGEGSRDEAAVSSAAEGDTARARREKDGGG